jgi:hypothetical protein
VQVDVLSILSLVLELVTGTQWARGCVITSSDQSASSIVDQGKAVSHSILFPVR